MTHVEILYNDVTLPDIYANLIVSGELGDLSELELDALAQLQDVLTASYREDYPTLTDWRFNLHRNDNAYTTEWHDMRGLLPIALYSCLEFDVIVTYA